MDWTWDIYDMGSVDIYYKGQLMWELETGPEYSEKELNIMVMEFIMQNQHLLRDED